MKKLICLIALLPALLTPAPSLPAAEPSSSWRCAPTPEDDQGPFYRPGAPVRSRIGAGYRLNGQVRSAVDCRPIAGAQIELWMTGPDGRYEDRWRATTFSGWNGRYRFDSHFPGPYGSRPPHIHVIVNAPGCAELVTQHYPEPGRSVGTFDLVLRPAD